LTRQRQPMTLAPLDPIDPHQSVMRLALGHVAARTVHALAHFRVADHIAEGARTLAELERLSGVRPFSEATSAMAVRTAETMIAFYGNEPAAVADAYDFSTVRVLADIGGSSGNLLTTILARHPDLRGMLFDLPRTAAAARQMLEQRGVADRCAVISGSFFDSVPSGADAYIVSHVIHDWPEEECEAILRNVRDAVPPGGRLLVIEPLITSGSDSDLAKFLDVIALTTTGGRHRTEDEHRALLARTGFRMTRVVETSAAVSIMESEPA
jgi:hypothetical protein